MIRQTNATYRRSNIGLIFSVVATLVLLGCARESGVPSQLSNFSTDIQDSKVEAHGIYPDGWAGDTISCNLQQPSRMKFLSIRGTIPQINNSEFRTDVSILIDGQQIVRRSLGLGDFDLSAPVKSGPGIRRISVVFSQSQILPKGDGRVVATHLRFLGFEEKASDLNDIVTGGGIQLGSGWGPIEKFQNQTFRWVENDAEFSLNVPQAGVTQATLTVEPGPSMENDCYLKTFSDNGALVSLVLVPGRTDVNLRLPVASGWNKFRLHVDGGGKRLPGDPRILNFRVFGLTFH